MKSHFKFNKQERSGIFFLLLTIILLQGAYFFIKWNAASTKTNFHLGTEEQAKIDSLKLVRLSKDVVKMYPFNPNFITDYKGYALGMSVREIDRLEAFRGYGEYVNSAEEFQEVTGVSDSLLAAIAPYFRFPEWTQKQNNRVSKSAVSVREIADLNTATASDLQQINGIGEILSARIVKFRERLGGFLINEQLSDVYGLELEVVERTLQRYQVLDPPLIQKININTASVDQISNLVYLPRGLAERIVSIRQVNGSFDSFDELMAVEGFPKEKIERIKLYLSF